MANRILLALAIAACSPMSALAEPASRPEPHLRASLGLSIVMLRRTTKYTDEGSATQPRHIDGRAVGGQVKVAVGFPVRPSIELGGFARLGRYAMHLTGDASSGPLDDRTAMTLLVVGPEVTVRRSAYYLRGALGLGLMTAGRVGGTYDLYANPPLGLLDVGAELGHEWNVADGRALQLGIDLSGTLARSGEDTETGRYDDRSRILTASLMLSFVKSK